MTTDVDAAGDPIVVTEADREASPDVDAAIDADAATDAVTETTTDLQIDADADTDDGSREVGEVGEGGQPPNNCGVDQKFTTIEPVLDLDSVRRTDDSGPRLTGDELTLYFGSRRTGQTWLYTAHREKRTDSFRSVTFQSDLNGPQLDDSPSVTPDGLTIYWESTRTNQYALWFSTRSALDQHWATPKLIESLSPPAELAQQGGPYILPRGDVLYFHQSLGTGQKLQLYRAEKNGGTWSAPAVIPSTFSDYDTGNPAVTGDDRAMYFASARIGPGSHGSLDIWLVTRQSVDEQYGPPRNVQELNTVGSEYPGWISPDGCRLYFVRDDFVVGGRVYVASRSP